LTASATSSQNLFTHVLASQHLRISACRVSVAAGTKASPRAIAGRAAARRARRGCATGVEEKMIAKEIEPLSGNEAKVAPLPVHNKERVFDSRVLFGQSREIRITHNGESYSLRVTRLGKLILTK
jgi:hemin uptake protein HemP